MRVNRIVQVITALVFIGFILGNFSASGQQAKEDFAYPIGTIVGQHGGTGWNGAWTGSGNVVAPGLSKVCNGQTPSGNALGPSTTGVSRSLLKQIPRQAGTSIMLSAVISSGVPASNIFSQATLNNEPKDGIFQIEEFAGPSTGSVIWGLRDAGGGLHKASTTASTNSPTCLIAQIDFTPPNAQGQDRLRLWVNPSVNLPLGNADVDINTTALIKDFSGISWSANGSQSVDSISINAGGGTWTPLSNTFLDFTRHNTDMSLLLTDGTILVHDASDLQKWYKFTPDTLGSYENGTWSKVAGLDKLQLVPSNFDGYAPWLFASAVLPDGRLIIHGNEKSEDVNTYCQNYLKGQCNHGAIYDPIVDTWTFVPPPATPATGANGAAIYDTCDVSGNPQLIPMSNPPAANPYYAGGNYWCGTWGPSVVLPNGNFMLGMGGCLGNDCTGHKSGTVVSKMQAVLPPPYDPAHVAWQQVDRSGTVNSPNSEQGWTLLPGRAGDTRVLTIDINFGDPQAIPCGSLKSTEIYLSLFDQWYCLGDTLDPLTPGVNDIGPQLLRPDGTVVVGSIGQYTAILDTKFSDGEVYTGAVKSAGVWHRGPQLPVRDSNLPGAQQLTMDDGAMALLPNGNVLMMTHQGTFLELSSSPSNVLVEVGGNGGFLGIGSMLVLPTGQIWFTPSAFGGDIQIYTPNNSDYDPFWAPRVTYSCPVAPCTIYNDAPNIWYGLGLSGVSQASAVGDEFQNATNYPLVRITDSSSNKVYYCRTYNFVEGVATSTTATTFDCPKVPAGLTGVLEVVANGIPSAAHQVNVRSRCASTDPTCHPQ